MTDASPRLMEELLAENNRLLTKQNMLLKQAIAASNAVAIGQSVNEIRERARRNTPWGCRPPTWAR